MDAIIIRSPKVLSTKLVTSAGQLSKSFVMLINTLAKCSKVFVTNSVDDQR